MSNYVSLILSSLVLYLCMSEKQTLLWSLNQTNEYQILLTIIRKPFRIRGSLIFELASYFDHYINSLKYSTVINDDYNAGRGLRVAAQSTEAVAVSFPPFAIQKFTLPSSSFVWLRLTSLFHAYVINLSVSFSNINNFNNKILFASSVRRTKMYNAWCSLLRKD